MITIRTFGIATQMTFQFIGQQLDVYVCMCEGWGMANQLRRVNGLYEHVLNNGHGDKIWSLQMDDYQSHEMRVLQTCWTYTHNEVVESVKHDRLWQGQNASLTSFSPQWSTGHQNARRYTNDRVSKRYFEHYENIYCYNFVWNFVNAVNVRLYILLFSETVTALKQP